MRRLALVAALLFVIGPAWAGQTVFFDTTMNGRAVGQAVQFDQTGDVLSAPAATWRDLTVILTPSETGMLTSAQLGLTCTVDQLSQSAACTGPADRFPVQVASLSPVRHQLPTSPNATGMLLGYDLAVAHTPNGDSWSSSQDARVITPWGILESTGQLDNTAQEGTTYKRGFTTWTTDWPGQRLVFQAGDITSNPIANLPSTLMGGFRLASDPSLDPSSPSFPIPVIGGVAAGGGTKVDAFLNAAPLGTVAQVGQGGFQLANPVASAGNNAMTLVMTDQFGRQTTIVDDFYVAPTLLRAGLDRWDVNLGYTRVDGGDTYRTPGLSASFQRGLSDHWTVQSAVQSTGSNSNGVLGLIGGGRYGTADLTVGASTGGGELMNTDYSYIGRMVQLSVGASWTNSSWWNLTRGALQPQEWGEQVQSQTYISTGLTLTPAFSLQGTYARVHDYDGTRQGRTDLRATYQRWGGTLGLDLEHANRDNSVFLTFSIPLGSRASINAQETHDAKTGDSGQVEAMGTWSHGDNLGTWDSTIARADTGTITSNEHAMWRNGSVQDDLTISTQGNQVSESNTISGALWLGSGSWFKSVQPVYDAFAVVRVPGIKGVRVYLENHEVGRTNSQGTLVISPLTSLTANSIRIETADLPIGVDVKSVIQTAVPDRKSGALIIFEVAGTNAREFHLHDTTGAAVPVGSSATVTAGAAHEDTVVGNDGVLYSEQAAPGAGITVDLGNGMSCHATMPTPLPAVTAIPTLTCR